MKTLSVTVTALLLEADDLCVFSAITADEESRHCKIRSQVQVKVGDTLSINGRWQHHAKYGWQFIAEQVRHEIPQTIQGIQAYLGSGKIPGVGKTLAGFLVRSFGADTLKVIESNPLKLTEVRGIGPEKANRIAQDIRGHRAIVHDNNAMADWGLPEHVVRSLDSVFGDTLMSRLKSNPYSLLAGNPHFDFLLADQVGRALSIGDSDTRRVIGAMNCVLNDTEMATGATIHSLADVLPTVRSAVGADISGTAIMSAVKDSTAFRFLPDSNSDNGESVYVVSALQDFRASIISQSVQRRTEHTPVLPAELEGYKGHLGNPFSLPIKTILQHSITLVTGLDTDAPTPNPLLWILEQLFANTDMRIHVAESSVSRAQLLGQRTTIPVSSLASLLIRAESKSSKDPLPDIDLLVINEAQILSTEQLHKLLSLAPITTSLILVGDVNRLPPVSPGDPFVSLIHTGAGYHYDHPADSPDNAGPITALRTRLADKAPVQVPQYPDLQTMGQRIYELQCYTLLTDLPGELNTLVSDALDITIDVHKHKAIQILTSTRYGLLGSNQLATLTASQLLPAKRDDSPVTINQCGIVKGDKIIATQTLRDWSIINGQTFTVSAINTTAQTVTLNLLSKPIPWRLMKYFQLTHALTVHRFQMLGEKKPTAIIVLDGGSDFVMTREWLYTALAFASERALIIGYKPALERCLTSSARDKRHCALRAYLQDPSRLKKAS